ncbi:MAG: pyruvate kinase alpha/beta domain-containing protein [Pseudomonadota bacterium]
MEEKIVYFDKPGKDNTEEVIKLSLERAISRGIRKIVVASTGGNTARWVSNALEGTGIILVVVPWQFGFKDKPQPFPEKLVTELREKKHFVHFGTMLFHTTDLYKSDTPQAMANLLRTFGQGMKVCIEIIMMACDGGCIGIGEKVTAIVGTVSGADTSIIATAAPSNRLRSLRINEIICKPLL